MPRRQNPQSLLTADEAARKFELDFLMWESHMPDVKSKASTPRATAVAAVLAAFPFAAAMLSPTATNAEANTHEITITIKSVKAIDKADVFSKGDFYARVTIDGDIQNTDVISQATNIKPNWKISKKVASGERKVKVEILDKDAALDDPIDINKVDNKRDLDFKVSTGSCRIEGFSSTYKCGSSITRAGKEKKAAEVTFTVNVK